jgi:glycerol uptake facilitator-like aquaporin
VDISRRLIAESVGTAFLLVAIVGSGIMAEGLSGGNEALALLCNSAATGAILVVLISVFGQVSGAHLNPAVTLSFAVRREIGAVLAVGYVLAQVIGGVLGTLIAHVMFNENLLQISTKARVGTGPWFAEALATFGLIVTIFGTQRWKADMVPVTVGLYIASAYWFTASTSFANPAVTLARTITNTFAGIQPSHAPAFIVAQLVGALAGALFCRFIFVQVTQNANRRRLA